MLQDFHYLYLSSKVPSSPQRKPNPTKPLREIVLVDRLDRVGRPNPDPHTMLQHQIREALAVDQDDAMLDAGHEVLRFLREVGGRHENAFGGTLSSQ